MINKQIYLIYCIVFLTIHMIECMKRISNKLIKTKQMKNYVILTLGEE